MNSPPQPSIIIAFSQLKNEYTGKAYSRRKAHIVIKTQRWPHLPSAGVRPAYRAICSLGVERYPTIKSFATWFTTSS